MKKSIFAAVALAAFSASSASAALLDGHAIGVRYLFPNTSSEYQNFGSTIINGTTLITNNLAHIPISLYASDTNLYVDYDTINGWTFSDFNGFVVSDINNTIDPFTSITINAATNLAGFDTSRISFDADNIYVNWQGLDFDRNTIVSLDLGSISAVPEPATWALMIGGFGLMGSAMRRRKTNMTVTYA